MDIAFLIIENLATFIETFLFFQLAKKLFKSNISFSKLIIGIIIQTIFITYCNHITIVSNYTMIVGIIMMSFVLYITFNVKYIYSIMTSAILYVCVLLIDMLCICCIGIIMNDADYVEKIVLASSATRVKYVILMKIVNVLTYILVRNKIEKVNYKILKNPVFILFTAISVVVAFKMMEVINSNDIEGLKLGISIMFAAFLFIISLVVYLADDLLKEKLKLKEQSYIDLKNQILETDLRNINNLYVENSKSFHEFRHHLDVLNTLVDNSEYDKIKEYISNINPVNKYQSDYIIDNEIVNIVMNVKCSEMKDKNIEFVGDFGTLASIKINENDLCSLLSNLMDNAIEAASLADYKKISLNMNVPGDFIIIKVSNSCSDDVNMSKLVSSKEGNHGWGINIIDDIVDKYNGEVERKLENDLFVTRIMIPFDKLA